LIKKTTKKDYKKINLSLSGLSNNLILQGEFVRQIIKKKTKNDLIKLGEIENLVIMSIKLR
jgi:hypothetical protein